MTEPECPRNGPGVVRLATDAMATRFEAVLVGADEPRLRGAGEAALAVIEETERRLSWFRPDSIVSLVNRGAADGPVAVDAEFFGLLLLCRRVWRDSAGAFDITLAPLLRAWGLRGEVPDEAAVGPARACTGMHLVTLDEGSRTVRFKRRGVGIDLGAVGKGHALDLGAGALREAGVECALLHGGTSSAVAIGAPPGEAGWAVAIHDEAGRRTVCLRDTALSVSAPRGRVIQTPSGAAHHILDPRSGRPSPSRVTTAAAVHASATLAEAWSTALVVLGDRPVTAPGDMDSYLHITDPSAPDSSGWRIARSQS